MKQKCQLTVSIKDFLSQRENQVKKWGIFVSGGVDSMVLLDVFSRYIAAENLVVLHINHQTRLLTALSQSAQVFDLTVKERATPWLTLIAKSNNDTQLKFTAGEQSWLVNLKATEHFQTLTLSVPLKEKSLSIQALKNTTEHIDFALYARTLADIPMDEVLYHQPNKLSAKSPTTELIIKNYLHKQHADYLASIEPYTPAQQQLNITDWEQLLMTANDLAESAPLDALRFLKKLSQHSNHQVAEKAWQARIDILRQQKQFHLFL